MASPTVLDVMATSIIQLTPASQAFVDMRATTLGPWVCLTLLSAVLSLDNLFQGHWRFARLYLTR